VKTWIAMAFLIAACSGGQQGPCASPQSPHLDSCTDACCGDGKNPPTSGGHCSAWLPCRVYTAEQNRCQWLHNLEHGHLVLLYNCPGGCPEIASALEGIWQSRPAGTNGARRALVSPDSQLPGKVAAVVFGHSWVGDAVDQAAIDQVIAHEDEASVPEAGLLCAQ
jgi:hypothetical protein